MAIAEIERKILIKLSVLDREVHPYIFYRDFQLSPLQISEAVKQLEKQDLVILSGPLVKVTDLGRRLVLKMNGGQFVSKRRPWRECPERFKAAQLGVNEPYIPRISLLDKTFSVGKPKI